MNFSIMHRGKTWLAAICCTLLLTTGRLTIDDVRFLMQGKKELMLMKALQQAGLAQIRLDTLRNSLIDMVIGTMSKAL